MYQAAYDEAMTRAMISGSTDPSLDFSAAGARLSQVNASEIMFIGRKPMTALHRREMFGVLLGGAVVATVGSTLLADPAESAPLTMSKSLQGKTENLVEKAVVVVRRRR
ncbi:MAG TPA: hypothetical protein VL996_09225, partial [Methylocella sp.]|nr:hypothetical protein [Methylocella sp.]